MNYRVISITYHLSVRKALDELMEQVNSAIHEGYEPIGGVAVHQGLVVQALIRRR